MLRLRWRSLSRRNRLEDELDDELRFHFESLIERFTTDGLPPAEARRRAGLDIGGMEAVKENCRDSHGVSALENLGRDVVYAWRAMKKSPGFVLTAAAAIALGIGANITLVSLVYSLMFRALPVFDPFIVPKSPHGRVHPAVCHTVQVERAHAGGHPDNLMVGVGPLPKPDDCAHSIHGRAEVIAGKPLVDDGYSGRVEHLGLRELAALQQADARGAEEVRPNLIARRLHLAGIPAADTRPWSGGPLAFGATMRSYSKDWIDPSESRRPCGRTTARCTIARYDRIYENHSMECPG